MYQIEAFFNNVCGVENIDVVLGDNRNNSEDSRFASVGMVKRKNVVGKVWMVIEPFDSFGFVK